LPVPVGVGAGGQAAGDAVRRVEREVIPEQELIYGL